jgi:hypothetical protein
MRDVWRIGMWMSVRLSTSEAPPPPDSSALPASQAAVWIRWVLDDGHRGRALLLEIAESLSGGFASHRADIEVALAIVRRGFEDGRLKAFAQQHVGGGKGPEQIDPPDIDPPKEDKKTFVAVQLLSDEPEPKPVPFKRYRIVLPDESVREGRLDQFGRALITGIDPGTCKVSFPDFDAADWKMA